MAGVKICGLTRPEDTAIAVDAGAEAVGAIVFEGSKRAVEVEALEALFAPAEGLAKRVAVVVDPSDALLDALTQTGALDLIQLHGHEPTARAEAVRARTGLGVVKAVPVATREDLESVRSYTAVCDWVLLDAKAAPGRPPGGNGIAFDWQLLVEAAPVGHWGLSGGLTPANVRAALELTGAPLLDVASGVETRPGIKDEALIRAFAAAART